MFKELSKATAPGLCASCHSVEQGESGDVNDQLAGVRSRRPSGVALPSSRTSLTWCCRSSKIARVATRSIRPVSTAASYTSLNPQQFVSDFKPLEQATVCGMPHEDGCRRRVPIVPQLSCGGGGGVAAVRAERRSRLAKRRGHFGFRISECGLKMLRLAIRKPQSAIRNSLEFPAEFGAGAADVGRVVEEAVHDVEPQQRGV